MKSITKITYMEHLRQYWIEIDNYFLMRVPSACDMTMRHYHQYCLSNRDAEIYNTMAQIICKV